MERNKDILRGIADNPALLQAVLDLIHEKFSMDQISTNMDNQKIGEVVRANIEGRAKVDAAFKELAQYRSPTIVAKQGNPAI